MFTHAPCFYFKFVPADNNFHDKYKYLNVQDQKSQTTAAQIDEFKSIIVHKICVLHDIFRNAVLALP